MEKNEDFEKIANLFYLLIESFFKEKGSNPNFYSYILRKYQIFSRELENTFITNSQQIRLIIIKNFLSDNRKDELINLECLLQKFLGKKIISQKNSVLLLLSLISKKNNKEVGFSHRKDACLEIYPHPQMRTDKYNNIEVGTSKKILTNEMIIKELLFVLFGLDGTFFRFNKTTNNYEIAQKNRNSPIVFKNNSQQILAFKIIETGYLFKKISQEINENSYSRQKFMVKTYLIEAITEELKGFYSLMNTLESQLQFPTQISLKSIYFLLFNEYEKLKWLNILWDTAMKTGYKGCQILNVIYHFSCFGYPSQKEFFKRIFNHTIKPLWIFIAGWMSSGQINDNNQEFFINEQDLTEKKEESLKKNDVVEEKENVWLNKFNILWEKTPNFLETQIIEKIFICGKTTFFLKKFCNSYDQNFTVKDYLFHSQEIKEFSNWVDQISQELNEKAVKILFKEFHFYEELQLIKDILLMGDGFFSDLLLSELNIELQKPCHQIYKHILMGILEKTLKKTIENKKKIKKLLERLFTIYIKRSSVLDVGWDLFSIDFILPEPLDQIITTQQRKVYWEIYNFLARTKRFQLEIQEIWKKTVFTARFLNKTKIEQNYKKLRVLIRQAEFTRNLISFFLNNFLEFLLIEGIESEWNCFSLNLMKKSKSIDDILFFHKNFLESLQKKFFLLNEYQLLANCILRLFEHIKAFVLVNNKILDELQSFLLKQKEKKLKKDLKEVFYDSDDENFSETSNSLEQKASSVDFEEFEAKVKFPKTIPEIQKEFQKTLVEFLNLLEKSHIKTTLTFKLNYNEYLDLRGFGGRPNYFKYEDLGNLLSPVKMDSGRKKFEKKNSSPDVRKEYSKIFREDEETSILNDGSDYIHVFNDNVE